MCIYGMHRSHRLTVYIYIHIYIYIYTHNIMYIARKQQLQWAVWWHLNQKPTIIWLKWQANVIPKYPRAFEKHCSRYHYQRRRPHQQYSNDHKGRNSLQQAILHKIKRIVPEKQLVVATRPQRAPPSKNKKNARAQVKHCCQSSCWYHGGCKVQLPFE